MKLRVTQRMFSSKVLGVLLIAAIAAAVHGENLSGVFTNAAGIDQKLNAQVPLDLIFRDESGQGFRLGNYFGAKPVLLVLAYYECPNLCTLVLNATLTSAQDLKFDAGKDFQIVVVSFDPRETP